ncbi:oxidoreductase [Acidocella aromatica]|uniref:NAD(P)-dependent dehydrogenase (Short-subunit alcohol dehydrogenase family) n=1 Tax=Acidocella aromatica TaxID=1303579 RepID=A0A840VA25_9PROT|nr:oxidoreductase [Acidocella aromatica]MBB5372576.1 NAD(P)-dependent dehydrogenase (short-subunit alcohol dehydrogenase family) [Acidocella aromatica]
MSLWPGAKLPSLTGKTVIVTGANSGIGYYTALELARAGADVVLACRSAKKGEAAAALVNEEAPGRAKFLRLDLSDFTSVEDFAGAFKETHGALDILVNNAGVMAPHQRQVTAQGFELQFGVNFLGHFLLNRLLLPTLLDAPAPRVVQIASVAHRQGRIDFEDLQYQRRYHAWNAYRQSKLAMLIFAQELQRRSDTGGWGLLSVAAHPGIAATEIVANGPGNKSMLAVLMNIGKAFVVQPGHAGAWPTLLAATDPTAQPGAYYGPLGVGEFRGPPGLARAKPKALDAQTGARLWRLAEELTGGSFTPGP